MSSKKYPGLFTDIETLKKEDREIADSRDVIHMRSKYQVISRDLLHVFHDREFLEGRDDGEYSNLKEAELIHFQRYGLPRHLTKSQMADKYWSIRQELIDELKQLEVMLEEYRKRNKDEKKCIVWDWDPRAPLGMRNEMYHKLWNEDSSSSSEESYSSSSLSSSSSADVEGKHSQD